MMVDIFSSFLATFITVPMFVYFVLFIVSKVMTKHHRRSVQLAIDYSTIFFILAVHFLIVTIWERSFLWVIIIIMLFCAIIFAIINWKVKGEIIFTRVFKGFWRFCFLIFVIAYLSLLIYGIIHRVNGYLS
ncbi:DUF3397 domain-containing protein [Pseudoneobacillus sp. C159]